MAHPSLHHTLYTWGGGRLSPVGTHARKECGGRKLWVGQSEVRGHGITLILSSAIVPESKCVHGVWQVNKYLASKDVATKCIGQSRLVMRGRGPRLMAR